MRQIELKTYPDPCLRVKTRALGEVDNDLEDLLTRMTDLMYESGGIGLAAPQVGVGIRVFVMDTGSGSSVFVDPEIIESSPSKTTLEEGCLSLPGITVKVSRPEKISVRARDSKGEMFTKIYDGLEAKAVQHEMEHLEGRLIIDHLDPLRRFFVTRRLSGKYKDQESGRCEVVCCVRKDDK